MRQRAARIRHRLLVRAFNLLYGQAAFLHEVAGRLLFGHAWDGRRRACAMLLGDVPGVILDLGCGEGRLVRYLRDSGMRVVGVDPSASMLRRARKRSVPVVRANGQALPFADDSIAAAVVTYPGPWIAERDVWIELARVVRPTGSVVLLVGGSYERGHAHRIRRVAARLAYGREREHDVTPLSSQPWEPDFSGTSIHRQDGWGMVAFWCGVRRAQEPDPFRVSGPSSS